MFEAAEPVVRDEGAWRKAGLRLGSCPADDSTLALYPGPWTQTACRDDGWVWQNAF